MKPRNFAGETVRYLRISRQKRYKQARIGSRGHRNEKNENRRESDRPSRTPIHRPT